ncbi:hypothetical protein [Sporosarcina sp. 6E9]|uniref:hypothetical protein n=1 Tax=Sporosarcina sp. 6E9 TaxID=2819235 RepID=UPI001B318055|nr:hypothetical protein [Sporosarcina sp. 6E9]
MELLLAFGIVAVVMCVPITAIITEHKRKIAKISIELTREQIELEQLKQQNFVIETEKMKIELEKMKLDFTPNPDEIMKI